MKKRIWIIGCSSGIGLELVKIFLKNDFLVVASARNSQNNVDLLNLKSLYEDNIMLLNIDVSKDENLKDIVHEAYNKFNGIDIFFFNAGVYEKTDIFNTNIQDFEDMININYLGAVRVLKYLLDLLENQKDSKIVFNASLSSYFGLPYAGSYGASKAALVSLAQSIQPELVRKNIYVQIINHGFVKTRLTNKNDFDMPQLLEASYAARKIFEELNKPYKFEIRFPFILSRFLQLISLLPYSLSLKITKRFLK